MGSPAARFGADDPDALVGWRRSHVIGATFAAIWFAMAAASLLRSRSDAWYTASLVTGIVGVAVMLFHGAVLRVLGNTIPVLFVPLAALLAICIRKSYDVVEFRRYRERTKVARRRGLRGRSKLGKSALIRALRAYP